MTEIFKNSPYLLLVASVLASAFIIWFSNLFSIQFQKQLTKRLLKSTDFQQKNIGKSFGWFLAANIWQKVWPIFSQIWLKESSDILKTSFTVGLEIFWTLTLMWFLWQAISFATLVMQKKAELTDNKFDDLLIPLLRVVLRFMWGAIALLMAAQFLEYDVSTLVAGLGIGSLAFALAAKDTIENLFGSVSVILDRPFQIGDWVVIDKVEGEVEQVGFRSTRIRTFYNSLITVPNSNLIKAVVDNMGQREFRRINVTLGLTYQTPAHKVSEFCEGVRQIIQEQPNTRKDYYQVWFKNFSESSLDIMLYCFLKVPDWTEELRAREKLLLDIYLFAEKIGVSFAYPTQTLFIENQNNQPT
jgi:MscS family membrane protein